MKMGGMRGEDRRDAGMRAAPVVHEVLGLLPSYVGEALCCSLSAHSGSCFARAAGWIAGPRGSL